MSLESDKYLEKITITNIAEGALVEKFDISLDKIMSNIDDPNTEAKKKREMVIKIKFTADENRDSIITDIECSEKLAPYKNASARIFSKKNHDTGEVAAVKSLLIQGELPFTESEEEEKVHEKKPDNVKNLREAYSE